jgi:serine O-acetyltransferase
LIVLFHLIRSDVRRKALWCYQSDHWGAIIKTYLTDGTMAMIYYRLMQSARRLRLTPLEMIFNKLNVICCNCVIGRGTEFGPGFVLIHSTGVVINGMVRGGANVYLYHQVTLGADRRGAPTLGTDVFIGAGAKVVGSVSIGDGSHIGANAVVVTDIPAHVTAVGIPARVVRHHSNARPAAESSGLPRMRIPSSENGDLDGPVVTP